MMDARNTENHLPDVQHDEPAGRNALQPMSTMILRNPLTLTSQQSAPIGLRLSRLFVDLGTDLRLYHSDVLASLTTSFLKTFSDTGESDLFLLGLAMKFGHPALDTTPHLHPNRKTRYASLGSAYGQRFKLSSNLDDLDQAIYYFHAAVDCCAIYDPLQPRWQQRLGLAFSYRFKRLGRVEDINAAVKYEQNALDGTPDNHPDFNPYQHHIAQTYAARFKVLKKIEDIDAVIFHGQAAVNNCFGSCLVLHQYDLANAYLERYMLLNETSPTDLANALHYDKLVLNATLSNNADFAVRQHHLASCYKFLYRKTLSVDDLQASLRHDQAALTVALEQHDSNILVYQHALGETYQELYKLSGNKEDIEIALKFRQSAADAISSKHSNYAEYQHTLSTAYGRHFQRTNNLEHLSAAIQCCQNAITASSDQNPQYFEYCHDLGTSYLLKFRRFDDLNDMKLALKYLHQAFDHLSEDNFNYPLFSYTLGSAYLDLFEKLSKTEDVEAAVTFSQYALKSAVSQKKQLFKYYKLSGLVYARLFTKFGDLSNLQMAIKQFQLAVNAIPAQLKIANAVHSQHFLALSLLNRYLYLKTTVDLKDGISLFENIISQTISDDPGLAIYQFYLGQAYRILYNEKKNSNYLTSAIQYFQLAENAVSADNPLLSHFQDSLGLAYLDIYNHKQSIDALKHAMEYLHMALKNTSDDTAIKADRQCTVGLCYILCFQAEDKFEYVATAFEYLQMAAQHISAEDPSFAHLQQGLSLCHLYNYREHNDSAALAQSLQHFHKAQTVVHGNPQSLWTITYAWARLTDKLQMPECLEGYAAVFRVLPNLIWLGSSITHRHKLLSEYNIPSLVSAGVAACLKYKNLQLAIELLEQGLAVTYQQLLQLRDDSESLVAEYPEYAQKLKHISIQLQQSLPMTMPGYDKSHISNPFSNILDDHRALAIERDKLLKKIRELPGFKDFLLPTPYKKLCQSSQYGPVIMLISTETSGDAIVLLSPNADPLHISLSEASTLAVVAQVDKLSKGLQICHVQSRHEYMNRHGKAATAYKAENIFEEVVTWLKNNIVDPIYNAIAQTGITDGRLWWCAAGPFTYLPLHAVDSSYAFIPSYTSTLGALLNGFEKLISLSKSRQAKVTAVGIPTIPNEPTKTLPFVGPELSEVEKAVGSSRIQVLCGEAAGLEAVTTGLKTASWMHLACHGQQNKNEPLKSCLLLYDNKLELDYLLRTPLPQAEFAFLSACQTAMGDVKLMNESMHLAGGLIFAGFCGVIGTLWAIADSDGPRVAKAVYEHLFADGKEPDVTQTAEALQIGVKKLRAAKAPFQRWAPFIHMGT